MHNFYSKISVYMTFFDIISNFHSITIFVMLMDKNVEYKSVGIFIMCLHTKFHIPSQFVHYLSLSSRKLYILCGHHVIVLHSEIKLS